MFDFDSWHEIFHTIRQNKLRTGLTAFGVFWGIFMLILLLGAGKGMQNGVEKGFSSDVRDSIWISSRTTALPYKGLPAQRKIQFVEADIEALKREIPGLNLASAENPLGTFQDRTITITYKNRSSVYSVFGVADHYFEIKKYQEYRDGRRLNTFDEEERRKVAVIGTIVAESLFPNGEDPIGEYIAINGVTFKVVGVFYDSGWEGRMSERVYIPLSAYQKTFGRGTDINLLTLTPKPGFDPFELEDQAVALLKERHRISPQDQQAIVAWNLARESQIVNGLFAAINGFVWFVGIGTLMAGIIGISNIMLITVKERTREIGVRKALGATPASIVKLIVLESIVITGVAGYLGLVLGVALLEGASYLMQSFNIEFAYFVRPEVNFQVAIIAILILVSVGTIAGLIPALKAARITPIEAMRDE